MTSNSVAKGILALLLVLLTLTQCGAPEPTRPVETPTAAPTASPTPTADPLILLRTLTAQTAAPALQNTNVPVLTSTPLASTPTTSEAPFTPTPLISSPSAPPPQATRSNIAKIAFVVSGGDHTCALTSSGGVKCWGLNDHGQLGDGTTINRPTPVDVRGLSSSVIAITSNFYHTCALTTGGGVKCWGENVFGQLGDGTSTTRLTPVDVGGLTSGVITISAGRYHTCAVTSSGGVKCWGGNNTGQLGDGTTADRLTPMDVSGLNSGVTAIGAGVNHTCALTNSGGVKCWGYNDSGQLGDGTATQRPTPVNVSGLTSGVSAIAAGQGHTCALMSGGGVKCWGGNSYGQLGDGTTTARRTPVDVSGLNSGISAVSAGGYDFAHTCALTSGGGVKCWGGNAVGQLGDGTTQQRLTPIDVIGLTNGVSIIAAGRYHTCAVVNGGVKCWGWNGYGYGQLGDGTTTKRLTPVDLVGLGGGTTP